MEQMTITAKVQIVATDADKVLLDETMSVYRDACNYVSDYVFQTHDLKQFSLTTQSIGLVLLSSQTNMVNIIFTYQ